MKIPDSTVNKAKGLDVGPAANRPGKTAEAPGANPPPSDKLTLSPKAQALAKSGSDTGAFDLEKVNQIKAAIASGQFAVRADRIADGLIDSVKDLISSRKS